jgi:hypothetical protein
MALDVGSLVATLRLDDQAFEQGLDRARGRFAAAGGRLASVAAAVGAGAATALGDALAGALSQQDVGARVAAQLGLGTEAAKHVGEVAGRVSADSVAAGLRTAGQALTQVQRLQLAAEDAQEQIGHVEDATGQAGAAADEMATARLASFQRAMQVAFVDLIGGKVLPPVMALTTWLRDQLGPTIAAITDWMARNGEVVGLVASVLGSLVGVILLVQAATAAWAVVQAVLNAALWANPIGLVILAIVALVAAIIWIATQTTWFQSIWAVLWEFLKGIGNWFANDFVGFFVNAYKWIAQKAQEFNAFVIGGFLSMVDFVAGMPGRIRSAASGMWDGIVQAFKGAINWLISMWNRLDLGLSIRIPEPLAGLVGFSGFTIPDLFPDIPYLAEGGIVPATPGGRLARLAEGGEDEAVVPLSKLDAKVQQAVTRAMARGGGMRIIRFEVGDQFRTWMREDVHAAGGVETYFSPVTG